MLPLLSGFPNQMMHPAAGASGMTATLPIVHGPRLPYKYNNAPVINNHPHNFSAPPPNAQVKLLQVVRLFKLFGVSEMEIVRVSFIVTSEMLLMNVPRKFAFNLQAVLVQGQDPLTPSMLAAAQPQEQKQMLGERLFPLIQDMYPDMAGKITGMLLEIDNSELLHMLESGESLKAKVIFRCNCFFHINNAKTFEIKGNSEIINDKVLHLK